MLLSKSCGIERDMLTPSVTLQQRTRKYQKNPMKIVNIEEENIHLS